MSTNEPTHVITDNPNVVPTGRDLALEAAATLAALLENRRERTLSNQKFTVERKELEKRAKDLIDEIKDGGGQLAIKFGSTVATTRALASTAPKDDEPDEEQEERYRNGDFDPEQGGIPDGALKDDDEEAETNEALH